MSTIFLHPAIRTYRVELFERLSCYNVSFLFTSVNDRKTHAGKETNDILEDTKIQFFQCKEIKIAGKRNFSFDLWRVFKYEKVIFSCATSIPFILLSLPLHLLGRRIILFDEMWKYPDKRIYSILRPIIRFLVRKTVNAYVAAGTSAATYMTDEYGALPVEISIAFNTTKLDKSNLNPEFNDKYIQLKKELQAGGKPVILYLGRVVKYKGLDVLLRALSCELFDAKVLVVGDGSFSSECKALTKKLGISDDVIFWGECAVEESTFFYELADMFVLPTRVLSGDSVGYESWGFTINEAMACGIPVVATDAVGAAHDLIIHKKTGWICPHDNPIALAEVINEVINLEDLGKEVGIDAKKYLSVKCSYVQNENAFYNAINN